MWLFENSYHPLFNPYTKYKQSKATYTLRRSTAIQFQTKGLNIMLFAVNLNVLTRACKSDRMGVSAGTRNPCSKCCILKWIKINMDLSENVPL